MNYFYIFCLCIRNTITVTSVAVFWSCKINFYFRFFFPFKLPNDSNPTTSSLRKSKNNYYFPWKLSLVPSTEIQIFTEMQMRMWLRKWICFQINEAPFVRLQLFVLNGCETVCWRINFALGNWFGELETMHFSFNHLITLVLWCSVMLEWN